MQEFIKRILDNKKYLAIVLIIVGILLVSVSYIIPQGQKQQTDAFSENEYIDQLESRLEKIVSAIDGAGECDVMISISSTTESVYVKENKKSYDNDNTKSKGETEDSVLTMTDSDGNQFALVTKQIMPEISGVTVVCDGGNKTAVQDAVINAVSTLLNIGSNKVCVIAKAK